MRASVVVAAALCYGCFSEPDGINSEPTTGVDATGSSSTGTDQGGSTSETDGDPTSSDEATGATTSKHTGEESTEVESTSDVEVPEPIAEWLFDGDTVDVSGAGHDGLVVGTVGYDVSPQGLALKFTGEGHLDLSSLANVYRQSLDALTVSAILRAESWSGPRHTLFALGVPSPDPADNAFILRIAGQTAELYKESGNSSEEFFTFGSPPPAQEWHRVTFVIDGSQLTYYVDGTAVGSGPITPPDTQTTRLVFGEWAGGNYFLGLLEAAAVFDTALTSAEVAALASAS